MGGFRKMNRRDVLRLRKLKQRNAKVAKVVAITSLSAVLIAPNILGAISVVMAEEANPTEQVKQIEKELFAEEVAPLEGVVVIPTDVVEPVANDIVDLAIETVPETVEVVETQVQEVIQEEQVQAVHSQAKAQSYSATVNWVVNQYEANVNFGDGLTGTLSGTDDLYFATETSGMNTGLNGTQVGTHTFTFDSGDLGEEEGTTYTITLVVTGEPTTPTEKPKAPQSVSATEDGRTIYASAEDGTSLFVKDAKGNFMSSGTDSDGLGNTVPVPLDRALIKGEKVQVIAINQQTDKESDPTWFTFQVSTEVTNKVIGLDFETGVELYSYNEKGLEGATKEITARDIADYGLSLGENKVKTMIFGSNGNVTFYYTKKTTPPVTEKTKLTIDFIDIETGGKVSESVVSEVEKGKETTVKAKEIKGYVLKGEATVKLTPTEASHTITFAYQKESVTVELDNATNVKFVEKSDGKQITATVPKGLTLVIVKDGTVIGKSSQVSVDRALTTEVTVDLDTRVAKGETIEYFTEDGKGNSSTTANLTRTGQEPTEPTTPTEPSKPNPVEPIEPSTPKPVEPTKPIKPSEVSKPATPTESTNRKKVQEINKTAKSVDGTNEKLIPQLGEATNLLTAIGMLIIASMSFITTKRKRTTK